LSNNLVETLKAFFEVNIVGYLFFISL